MNPPAQSAQNFCCLGQIGRFPNNFIVQRDQSVGRNHNFVRMGAANGQSFPGRVQDREFTQGQMCIGDLGYGR